jgi:ribosomal protein S18 acetylase RimI-like enzyme
MYSHPGYPRESADYPSGCFHGFPDTRAANGRATQIWHTRTENTVNDARIGVDVQEKEGNMTEPIAMTIRHMKIEDYPLVYELWIRCTGFTMRDIDDCKDAIKTFLERNPNTCFVAEDDGGRIIGAILAGHDGRRSRIYHTAVDPDARGRGIGSILVGRVVETLRAIGLPKVAVGVPADNDAGNDFWERQGFAVRDDLVYRELPL